MVRHLSGRDCINPAGRRRIANPSGDVRFKDMLRCREQATENKSKTKRFYFFVSRKTNNFTP
jgi:hypothetical protein